MAKNVLILGSQGMLGQELKRVFGADEAYQVTAWDMGDVDVTDFKTLRDKVIDLKPGIIINAVAYNAVDACEEDEAEYGKALLLNRDVPAELALIVKEQDILLVHYSTDYVFDGDQEKLKSGLIHWVDH